MRKYKTTVEQEDVNQLKAASESYLWKVNSKIEAKFPKLQNRRQLLKSKLKDSGRDLNYSGKKALKY